METPLQNKICSLNSESIINRQFCQLLLSFLKGKKKNCFTPTIGKRTIIQSSTQIQFRIFKDNQYENQLQYNQIRNKDHHSSILKLAFLIDTCIRNHYIRHIKKLHLKQPRWDFKKNKTTPDVD